MRFKGLDLNLLVALDVLLTERSVSRSGERLGLSQPATSAALARLRDFFSDDLLVQHGKKMFPTPYAEGLAPQLRDFLRSADALVATSAVFDPATSERTFRIIASDYIVVAVLAPLVRRLAESAPRIAFEFVAPDQLSTGQLQTGDADLLITPSDFVIADQATELLLEERHVIAGCRNNSLFSGPITEERIFEHGHVAVQLGATRQATFADNQLRRMGKPRRVEVVAGSFTSVPWLLIDTDRVAVMHERLAREMARKFPIAYAPLPFAFPVMQEMIQFHSARSGDEGLRWLRGQIAAHVAQSTIRPNDRHRSRQ